MVKKSQVTMVKKGQVTFFIILGIVLVVATVLMFLLQSEVIKEKINSEDFNKLELQEKSNSLQQFIESCITSASEDAIRHLGYYGGKNNLSLSYFEGDTFDANYIYHLGEIVSPSLSDMEISLVSLFNNIFIDCVQNFSSISEIVYDYNGLSKELIYGVLEVDKGTIETTVSISNSSVSFDVDWPLKLTLKDMEKEISNFPKNVLEVDLERMGIFINDFAYRFKLQPYIIDQIYLINQNYSIDISLFSNDTYVFYVEDSNSMIDNESLKFLFASKVNITGVFS